MAMKTQAIIKAIEIAGGLTALANELGVTVGAVHQWKAGIKAVPARHCPKIESITGGQVTAEELCPDFDWHLIRGSNRAA